MEIYMFLSHMETRAFFPFHMTRTHFPSRDFIQQEVLKPQGLSRGNESSDFYCFLGHTIIM